MNVDIGNMGLVVMMLKKKRRWILLKKKEKRDFALKEKEGNLHQKTKGRKCWGKD